MRRFCNEECPCGRKHSFSIDDIIVESGAIERISEIVSRYGAKRVFLLADMNTYTAAGERICNILESSDIGVRKNASDAIHPMRFSITDYQNLS